MHIKIFFVGSWVWLFRILKLVIGKSNYLTVSGSLFKTEFAIYKRSNAPYQVAHASITAYGLLF